MTKVHIVLGPHETLSQIARTYGVPLAVLRNINSIGNENRLQLGQKIYLREEDVLGVQVLLLDADRNPINGLKYSLELGGRVQQGVTACGGLTQKVYTERPTDRVRILIERLDGSLKEVATVDSGFRNKLVTVLTPRCRADAKTELDNEVRTGEVAQAATERKPIQKAGERPPATLGKKKLGPEVARASSSSSRPLTQVKGDIPELDLFLGKHDETELTEDHIKQAAKKLECEPALIKALARQESARKPFTKLGGRIVPTILYERHVFRDLTTPAGGAESSYRTKYPDICGPKYHRAKRNEKKELIDVQTEQIAIPDDIYGRDDLQQYKRLVKAYQLDADAALQSCSWGKFQILGRYFKECAFKSVKDFVLAMSHNEVEQLDAFVHFAASKKDLAAGLRDRDFEKIASGYNGKYWKRDNPQYAENVKKFYEVFTHEHDKS